MTKQVALLGATGSIGQQTLDVVRAAPDRYRIVALAAGSDTDAVRALAAEFEVPPVRTAVAARDGDAAVAALGTLGDVDVVVNAVVGVAGLAATLAALEAGKRLALANKESLVAGGPLVDAARRRGGGELIPVDSEHSALFQCLRAGRADEVQRLTLTASGGPFRGRRDLTGVTVEEALAHPTWRMGAKITVDSATLMNKGLEVIEAHRLFGVDYDRIDVVVHPQSIVHSLVTFADGSTVAHLGVPDMRVPIQYALSHPERHPLDVAALDLVSLAHLDFEAPDLDTFRCLALAYEAGRQGGFAPAVLNVANEEAVAAFLEGRLGLDRIADVVAAVVAVHGDAGADDVGELLGLQAAARATARDCIAGSPTG